MYPRYLGYQAEPGASASAAALVLARMISALASARAAFRSSSYASSAVSISSSSSAACAYRYCISCPPRMYPGRLRRPRCICRSRRPRTRCTPTCRTSACCGGSREAGRKPRPTRNPQRSACHKRRHQSSKQAYRQQWRAPLSLDLVDGLEDWRDLACRRSCDWTSDRKILFFYSLSLAGRASSAIGREPSPDHALGGLGADIPILVLGLLPLVGSSKPTVWPRAGTGRKSSRHAKLFFWQVGVKKNSDYEALRRINKRQHPITKRFYLQVFQRNVIAKRFFAA